jgi:sulfatase modifying factor 1
MRLRLTLLTAFVALEFWMSGCLAASIPDEITSEGMRFVVINQPGNPADTRFGVAGRGSVGYLYSIGKYEVTVAQWVEFMNAKGKTDDTSYLLGTGTAQIVRGGTSGGYRYVSQPFKDAQPIVGLDWFRAARFANWMHNGKGDGSTETGAYSFNGFNAEVNSHSAEARFWIPSINEWHKAAYFNGDSANPQYSTYATQSNDAPTITTVDAFFDGSGMGAGNSANYRRNSVTSVANVGTSGGPSAYGTFDMAGNAAEAVSFPTLIRSTPREFRWDTMGGDCVNGEYWIAAGSLMGVSTEYVFATSSGVRLAAVVPEPTTSVMLLAVGTAWGWAYGIGRRRRPPSYLG